MCVLGMLHLDTDPDVCRCCCLCTLFHPLWLSTCEHWHRCHTADRFVLDFYRRGRNIVRLCYNRIFRMRSDSLSSIYTRRFHCKFGSRSGMCMAYQHKRQTQCTCRFWCMRHYHYTCSQPRSGTDSMPSWMDHKPIQNSTRHWQMSKISCTIMVIFTWHCGDAGFRSFRE